MLKQALILAAGRGQLIGDADVPNCLAPIGGQSLIARWLRVLARAGVQQIGIVTGWQHGQLRRHVDELRTKGGGLAGLDVTYFHNTGWDKPNGLSVLAGRAFLRQRTLLVMADQIAAPALVQAMVQCPDDNSQTLLALDRDLSRVFDFEDATKVQTDAGGWQVQRISKALRQHDAVSVGLFVVAPNLVSALDELHEPSLTEGVDCAARKGWVIGHDVRGALWQDVDSVPMRLHAEWLLRVYGDELAHPEVPSPLARPAFDTMALVDRLLSDKEVAHYTLLNPGPVMTSARVKSALIHHDTCHRDDGYSAVVRRLQGKLRRVFAASDQHEAVLITGSGTAAMEMALSSLVPPEGAILTIDNGAFGERLGEIARLHKLDHRALTYAWGELPKPADVEAALTANPAIAVVAMIHHETSVGLVNPVHEIGQICRARGVLLVVDAVSSLGAEDVDVVRDNIDVCYSSANKCLHSASGVSFLCVAPGVWPRVAAIPPRVYYLDLRRYKRYLEELDQTPFTPAVSAFFALETALDELEEQGGVVARRETYRRRNLRIRRVLTDLGFRSFSNTGRESHTICTMKVPDAVGVEPLYSRLKDMGFLIYRCKGALTRDHIQIANMGELPDATIDAFLAAVGRVVGALRPESPRQTAQAPA